MRTPAKPILTTPRLRLRPVTAADAGDLCALDADLEVRRYVDLAEPPSLENIRNAMIPRWQAIDAATPAVGFWIAETAGIDAGGDFVGWFHLRPPRELPGGAGLRADDLELGFRLRRAFWGKGLATEGGRALIDYAFNELAAPRVVATALAPNAGSIRVMEKLGMVRMGDWAYKADMPAVAYAVEPL
jgi:RimJ/RimL family protein N-acetyltransferase